jgi:hypothetical protein
MKKVPSVQKGKRICDTCSRKTVANLPDRFGNESVVSSSSEYEKQKGRLGQF